jgi:aspartate kinase
MIVMKFGGTSVADAARVRQVATIIEAQSSPRAAVVSAASGVTNKLLDAARAAAVDGGELAAKLVAEIRTRHHDIASAIDDDQERAATVAALDQHHAALDDALADVDRAGELSLRNADRIVSTGEKAMSLLLAAMLRSIGIPAVHVWADRVIATDNRHGNVCPDLDLISVESGAQESRAVVGTPSPQCGRRTVGGTTDESGEDDRETGV